MPDGSIKAGYRRGVATKRKPAKPAKGAQPERPDVRDVFLAMMRSGLTRACDEDAPAAIREHRPAWDVFYALALAARSDGAREQHLLAGLHRLTTAYVTVSKSDRRLRFRGAVEAAARLFHGIGVQANRADAVVHLQMVIGMEMRARDGATDWLSMTSDDDEQFLDVVGTDQGRPITRSAIAHALESLKLPDSSRPKNRQGGRGAVFGFDAVAAVLSRRFKLFDDHKAKSNAMAARSFKDLRTKKSSRRRTK